MLFGVLFTLPAASTSLASIGEYSSPLFDEFLPFIYILFAILVPALIIGIILRLFMRH